MLKCAHLELFYNYFDEMSDTEVKVLLYFCYFCSKVSKICLNTSPLKCKIKFLKLSISRCEKMDV
jgi:hypothetical protein